MALQMHQRKRKRRGRTRGRPDRACAHEGEWDPWPTDKDQLRASAGQEGSHCGLRVPLPPSPWPALEVEWAAAVGSESGVLAVAGVLRDGPGLLVLGL